MIEAQIEIVNKLGLHARAAAKFISCTGHFAATVRVGKNPNSLVDGKSIMAVMMLAAAKGTMLHVCIEGKDEAQAWDALQTLINNRFDEGE
ncbi:MAG: HPr family phosphocarrier protein [Halieaceae bacterium]|jgi:phosphocarrier protein|nr:HPr family phosphocarrier protein [Halieaceae bacterium]